MDYLFLFKYKYGITFQKHPFIPINKIKNKCGGESTIKDFD